MMPFFGIMTDFKSIISWIMTYSICAIDFPTYFPRNLCKTEDFGISYADVGAASAVFVMGLCSRKIREEFKPGFKHDVFKDVLRAISGSLSAMLMGGIRFGVHYFIGY